jgi:hypothetical protein
MARHTLRSPGGSDVLRKRQWRSGERRAEAAGKGWNPLSRLTENFAELRGAGNMQRTREFVRGQFGRLHRN